jgi:hypothetical protein
LRSPEKIWPRVRPSPSWPRKDRETFRLSDDAEAALLLAIEEADRGEVISGDDLLRELRRD